MDPLTSSYSMLTPYQFASNTPIAAADLDGLEGDTKFEIQESRTLAVKLSGEKATSDQINQNYNKIHHYRLPTNVTREDLHLALDVFGAIPVIGEVADGINAIFYFVEGDVATGAISAMAIIPIIGEGGKVGKYIVKYGDEAIELKEGAKIIDEAKLVDLLKKEDAYLKKRSDEIHGILDARAQSERTTAAGKVVDKNGNVQVFVASNEKTLSKAQKEALKDGEIPIGQGPFKKEHAEIRIKRGAEALGRKYEKVAASRPICEPCQKILREHGTKPINPKQ